MSDVEENQVIEEIVEEEAESVTINDCIKTVLRTALVHDGLARGLREATKALSRGEAELCVLCDAVTEDGITTLVEALCTEQSVPLIKVSDAKELGEWAGLCQLDRDGEARKVVGASCVVVTKFGADTEERSILLATLSE